MRLPRRLKPARKDKKGENLRNHRERAQLIAFTPHLSPPPSRGEEIIRDNPCLKGEEMTIIVFRLSGRNDRMKNF